MTAIGGVDRIDRVVVVGASAAGLTTAEGLRDNGYGGELTLVGAELHLPYDRPPLSKRLLDDGWTPERALLREPAEFAGLGMSLLLGTAAVGLDVASRMVRLADGRELGYDRLVIATGVQPRRLPSGSLRGVHVLRTLDDALMLRSALAAARRVAVVGTGWLGTEVAAVAREAGHDVTLVGAAVPLLRQVGPLVGELIARLHAEHGVRLELGVRGARVVGAERVAGVLLGDGRLVPADLVVVAVGSDPATGWLAGSGLRIQDGVRCDPWCRAAPGVYAAGDVARRDDVRLGVSLRLECRTNATDQALAVADAILGPSDPYSPIPYFWSDQYDVRLQSYGLRPPGARVQVVHGDPERGRFVVRYSEGDRTVGALAWNMPREIRAERALLVLEPPAGVPVRD